MLRFEPVDVKESDILATEQLFQSVWPNVKRLNAKYLAWLYRDNPCGSAIGMNAWDGTTLAGHYVVIPIEASHQGQIRKAALSLNTAVHPDYRGQGLFTKLAEQTYSLAKALGVDHVVGVANQNSTWGFVKSLGFQLVTPLPGLVFFSSPTLADSSLDWQRHWTPEVLRWRLQNPEALYSYQKTADGLELNGGTKYPGVRCALRFERDPKNQQVVVENLPEKKMWRPRLWFGLNHSFKAAVSVPQFLRGSPLNLIYRPLANGKDQLRPEEIQFSPIDFDVV